MTTAIQLLKQAVSERPSNQREYRWEDLLAAIDAVAGGVLDWEAEHVLLQIVRFAGELRLSEDTELPHSMSPEEMLKSVAIQALARWTGLTHLLEMQRVEATASSPVLASIVRATIRGVTRPKLSASELEVVAEVQPSPREVARGPLARGIGERPVKPLPQGRPKGPVNKQTLEHYTIYDVPWTPPSRKRNIVKKLVFHEHGLTFLPGGSGRKKRIEEEPVLPSRVRKRVRA